MGLAAPNPLPVRYFKKDARGGTRSRSTGHRSSRSNEGRSSGHH